MVYFATLMTAEGMCDCLSKRAWVNESWKDYGRLQFYYKFNTHLRWWLFYVFEREVKGQAGSVQKTTAHWRTLLYKLIWPNLWNQRELEWALVPWKAQGVQETVCLYPWGPGGEHLRCYQQHTSGLAGAPKWQWQLIQLQCELWENVCHLPTWENPWLSGHRLLAYEIGDLD